MKINDHIRIIAGHFYKGQCDFLTGRILKGRILIGGCARRGASGALYPKSAIAGLNSHSSFLFFLGLPLLSGVDGWVLRSREL